MANNKTDGKGDKKGDDFAKFTSALPSGVEVSIPKPGDDGVGAVARPDGSSVRPDGSSARPDIPAGVDASAVKVEGTAADMSGLTGVQNEMLQSVIDSRRPVQPSERVQQPQQPVAVPTPQSGGAAWSPYQSWAPEPLPGPIQPPSQTILSTMSGASLSEIKAKEGTPPILVEAYVLLRNLVAGGWITPGARASEAVGLVERLSKEVEG